MASAIALPLSALLPPSDTTKGREVAARALLGFDAPSTPLPKHTAILGPLPPSAPLSAADAFLALADIPAFEASEHTSTAISTYAALYALQPRPHALVLTGPREQLHLALEEQDPPFLRSHSYDLLDRLRRTDVRYAPSFGHLRLLIAVLGSEGAKVAPPSLVVLYDILGLLTMPGEREENKPPDVEETEADQPELARVLRPGVTLASYLELVAAALDLARAAGNVPILILEPGGDIALPLLVTANETVPPTQRTRTAQLSDGLRRLGFTVGRVSPVQAEEELTGTRYELVLSGETHRFACRPGVKSEFACPPREEGEQLETGGWVWEWT